MDPPSKQRDATRQSEQSERSEFRCERNETKYRIGECAIELQLYRRKKRRKGQKQTRGTTGRGKNQRC